MSEAMVQSSFDSEGILVIEPVSVFFHHPASILLHLRGERHVGADIHRRLNSLVHALFDGSDDEHIQAECITYRRSRTDRCEQPFDRNNRIHDRHMRIDVDIDDIAEVLFARMMVGNRPQIQSQDETRCLRASS